MVKKGYTSEQNICRLRKAEVLLSHAIVVSGRVRLSPISNQPIKEIQYMIGLERELRGED